MKVGDMRLLTLIAALCVLSACGGSQQTRPDFSELRNRSSQAHQAHRKVLEPKARSRKVSSKPGSVEASNSKKKRKATSKLGVIRGEGSGTTRHAAVVSALQGVSAQVLSRVRGRIVTEDFENDMESTGSVKQRLEAETSFPYAELIRVVDVQRSGPDFLVIAELDRGEAIAAIRKGAFDEATRFEREVPRIEQALLSKDYAVLLSRRYNPSFFLAKRQLAQRMLKGLGGQLPTKSVTRIERLALRVAKARSAARLRLRVTGDVSKTIRDAAKNIFTDILKRRGCQMLSGRRTSSAAVDVHLTLKARDHEEFDAQWVDLGFELNATTRTDGQVVASVNGMPEFVHGGGMSKAQAEQAALTELRSRLDAKVEIFDELICAESL